MAEFSFPWLAILRFDPTGGAAYSVFIDSDVHNGRTARECYIGKPFPMTDRDRVRLEKYVALVHVRKEDRDDYTIGDFQVFREERLFDFEPNPAHQPSAA